MTSVQPLKKRGGATAVIKEKGIQFTAFFLFVSLFGALKAFICYLRSFHILDVLIISGIDFLSCCSAPNAVESCT